MLPKNLHWWMVGLVLAGIVVALSLNAGKETSRHASQKQESERNEAAALARETPDLGKLVHESAPLAQPSEKDHQEAKVPGLQPRVAARLAHEESAANGAEAARYSQGVRATSPILVLTGEESQAKPAQPSAQELLLQNLAKPAPVSALAPQDRALLASGAGANAAPGASESAAAAYLSQAERKQAWFRKAVQEEANAKPASIGVDAAVSGYTVLQGTPIPAVIVSEIESDLPGSILARTTQDIYDSVSGRHLLIPAGSLVYGRYDNAVTVGEDRLAAVFDRIVFPNGAGVRLAAMPGAGSAGEAGLPGQVDNHFWRVFGSSMLIAGVAALLEPRARVTNNVYLGGSAGTGGAVTDAAGQVIVDVTRRIESRNATIAPTVRVQAGQRFTIVVQKDLALALYRERAW